jgi:hypothetical protein
MRIFGHELSGNRKRLVTFICHGEQKFVVGIFLGKGRFQIFVKIRVQAL